MSEQYQIVALKNFKWRKGQSTPKPGDVIKVSVLDILDVPGHVSHADGKEICDLELAKLYEEGDDLSDLELDLDDPDLDDDSNDDDLDDEPLTLELVQEQLREVKKSVDEKTAKDIMSKYGYSAMKAIQEEHFVDIYNDCVDALAEE